MGKQRVNLGGATLFLGNCISVMQALPAASVDLVLTDPPILLALAAKPIRLRARR